MKMRRLISIIGDASVEEGSPKYEMAFNLGKALVDNGYRVASGGLNGIMRAAFKGAKASKQAADGDTIAITPMFDRSITNEYADIVVATGLDVFRNVIVANSDAVIAVGGGSGTMCEICNAWALKKMILATRNVDGWSAKVADTRLDNRIRLQGNLEIDKVFGINNPIEAIALLKEHLNKYLELTYTRITKD
jgi:rossmann fold nucleotide-binding protein-like protein